MRTIDVHFSAILFVNMLLKVQKVFEQKVDMQEITIDHMQRGRTSVNAPRLVLEKGGFTQARPSEITMLSLLRGSDGTKYNVNTTSVLLAGLAGSPDTTI